ncbi:hypothetical protein H0V99_03790 [Candidatus Saccharibacteria bacterium]|nr:hypothetical protein [Candidatus Saccharibacteria bacterium]
MAMDKREAQHLLGFLRKLPNWILLAASIFFLIIAVFALRANNQRMIELRAAVFVADEQDGDVEGALRALREHVYKHMNTDLAAGDNAIKPPIQLKYRYERLVAAEKAKNQNTNDQVYTDAQDYCEQQIASGFSGRGRIPCIQEYVDTHGTPEGKAVTIPEDAYKFDFASPSWSPDLAGWSLVLAALFFGLFVIWIVSEYILHQQLRLHN